LRSFIDNHISIEYFHSERKDTKDLRIPACR
jgi:hypothetical protein